MRSAALALVAAVSLLACPTHAQTASPPPLQPPASAEPKPSVPELATDAAAVAQHPTEANIQKLVTDLGDGTLGTYDKGHVALQWGPIAGVAIAQPQRLAENPSLLSTTAGKTGFVGVALTLSFWPQKGAFLAHVSAFVAAAVGAADLSTHAPVAGAVGLVVSCGGVGLIPPIGVGVLQPVVEGAGAGIPMLPELVLTGQLPNLLAKLSP